MTIFENSFVAHLFWSLRPEMTWFLAMESGHPMLLPTLTAIAASFLAWAASYAIGRVVALAKIEDLHSEDGFRRAQYVSRKYLVWLLLLPWIPFIAILPLMLGALRVPAVTVLSLALAGRCLYYAFYLIA